MPFLTPPSPLVVLSHDQGSRSHVEEHRGDEVRHEPHEDPRHAEEHDGDVKRCAMAEEEALGCHSGPGREEPGLPWTTAP